MVEEDQTLRLENDVENHQTLIYGIGDQQLDVVASRILNRYKVEIELYRPKVAYRETLRKKVQVNIRSRLVVVVSTAMFIWYLSHQVILIHHMYLKRR